MKGVKSVRVVGGGSLVARMLGVLAMVSVLVWSSAGLAAVDLARLSSQENGQIIPLVSAVGTQEARLFGDTVFFITEDTEGRLVYTWELPMSANDPPLGRITVQAQHGDVESRVIPAAHDAKLDWVGEVGASQSVWEPAGEGRYKMVRKFQVDGQVATMTILGRLVGKSLVLEMTCDQGVVSRVIPGNFGAPIYKDEPEPEPEVIPEPEGAVEGEGEGDAEGEGEGEEEAAPPAPAKPKFPPGFDFFMRRIDVPFLSTQVRGFVNEELFTSVLSDWRVSSDAGRGEYVERSDGSRVPVVARFIYTASWHFEEVLPNIPNAAGSHRELAAQRMLLEIPGKGPYELGMQRLAHLVGEGMTDYAVVVKDWQNKGPEGMLPAHMPPHVPKDSDEKLPEEFGKLCRKYGMPLAYQEEYSDMYLDYEQYDDKYLVLDTEGVVRPGYKPRRGNLGPGGMVKPSLVGAFAKKEGSDINRAMGTTAAYLHRHTSVAPERVIDLTATEAGAGTAKPNYEATAALLTGHREIHEGPVMGLGGVRHWQYAGLADAFLAEPGAGWKAKGGADLPLLPSFSLVRIRPLSTSYGMGKIDNWMPAGDENGKVPWGYGYPMVFLDQYRMQEVVFGHAPRADESLEGDLGWHWLEQNLTLPVSKATAAAKVAAIEYHLDGEWVGTGAAILGRALDVIRVRYDNGVEVVANAGEEDFDSDGVILPPFGWVARNGAEVIAWTAKKDGAYADYSKSEDGIFVNGRRAADWKESSRIDGLKVERGSEGDWPERNLNTAEAIVDFGVMKTDGCVSLRKDESDYVLTVFPRDADFTLLMNGSAFRAPFAVESPEGAEKETRPEAVGDWWRLPLNGAVEYRFPAGR
ncbi:MAG: hypothetical protein AAF591_11035 [Verrucomicrobiota bacterium]